MAAGAISFIAALVLVPAITRVCARWGLYDSPGPLKIHSRPIPRLGGVAILLALAAGILGAGHSPGMHAWPFWFALTLIWTAGFVDDISGLSAILRMDVQISAGVLLWYGGWQLPFAGNETFGAIAVCLFTILLSNAFNFLDGSDGLCAGVAGIIALAYVALPGAALGPLGLAVAWSLLGAASAFLFSNFPPATIFMGDSGSTVLGFGVAFLALDFYRANTTRLTTPLIFFPILLASLPLLDAALAILRRLRGRGSILHGDRRHFYDLLLAAGWPPRKVALATYALTAGMCLIAWLGLQREFAHAFLFYLLSVGALLFGALRLGSLRSKDSSSRAEGARG